MCCKKLILLLIVFGVFAGFSGVTVVKAVDEASEPYPAHEATGVPVDVVLYWTPGDNVWNVNGHDVYFGETFNDINDINFANKGDYPNVTYEMRDVNDFDPPVSLDKGRTYYWRVDEVNGINVWEGPVWSFTVVQPPIIVWDDESGDNLWRTLLNWDLDIVPTAVLSAKIMLSDPNWCDITSATAATAHSLKVGDTAGPGELRMTGGVLDIVGAYDGDLVVGANDVGIFDMSGGALTIVDDLTIADDTGSADSEMTLSGTADVNVLDDFIVGDDANGTFNMSDGFLTADDLIIADDTGSDGSTMTMTGGIVDVNGNFEVGEDGRGTFTISGGSLTTTSDADAKIADNGGGDGSTMTVTGTGTVNLADNKLDVGEDGVGHLVISADGSLTLGEDLTIADDANSDGSTMTMTGGSVIVGDDFYVGDNALGTFTIADGNLTVDDDLEIADGTGSNGSSMTITGGTVIVDGAFKVGDANVGTFTISGGSLSTIGGGDVKIADDEIGSDGSTMTISGTATVTFGDKLHVGRNGVGYLVMSDGSLTVANDMAIGDRSNSSGSTMTMTGGTVTLSTMLKVGDSDDGTLNMSGGSITISSDLLIADGSGAGGSTMTMSGGSVDVTRGDFIVGDSNEGTFTMSGGSLTVDDRLLIADGGGTGGSTMTLSGTADVNVSDDMLVGDDDIGYLNMSGGSLTVGDDLIIADESGGAGSTMTLTGGTVTVNDDFEVKSGGHVDLDGGTIYADDLDMTSTGSIDITAGTLILSGNEVTTVQGYASNGWITGYGDSRGVVIEYNSGTNKTTVTADASPSSSILALAYLPNPYTGETGVVIDPILSWTPGDYVSDAGPHRVNFGDDPENPGNIAIVVRDTNDYSPGPLALGKTYYWRVDEANGGGWDIGLEWRFTVVNNLVVDNFEDYAIAVLPYRSDITLVWIDGYTYSPNGTSGALVTVSTEYYSFPANPPHGPGPVCSGSEAMRYDYDNDGSVTIYCPGYAGYTYSADANYSEIAASTTGPNSLGIDPNWAGAGIKALSLWFYGDPDNDANEQMYVALDDGTDSNGVVNYDGDMNDIKIKAWQEWNIELQDFNDQGVNLADINNIYIGFGIRGNTTTTGGSGVVYFDDIRFYPTRCVLSLRSDDFALVDFTGDCVVDGEELEVMAGDWLESDGFIDTVNPTDANLKALYQFENNTLDSAGTNHGTEYGSPTYATGVVGSYAIELNGSSQYVEVEHSDSLNLTKDFTIAAWVYPDVVSDRHTIVAKLTDVHDKQYALEIDDEEIEFEYELSSNNYAMSSGTVTAGSWQHVAVTIDSSLLINLYIDGAPVDSETAPSEVSDEEEQPLVIGRRSGSYNGDYFNGLIDDVRIYNRALSDAEVAYLADTTPGDGWLYVPVDSPADLFEDEPELSRYVNFKDYAVLMDEWLDKQLFP